MLWFLRGLVAAVCVGWAAGALTYTVLPHLAVAWAVGIIAGTAWVVTDSE